MATRHRYKNFAELSRTEREGSDYIRRSDQRRSGIAILAPHGGGIEPGTSEIAQAIAGQSFSFYTFEGVKQKGNERLHITSTFFDEPTCLDLLESTRIAITIHGCEGKAAIVHVGGLHRRLRTCLITALRGSGFDAREAGSPYPGNEPENLCNRGHAGGGVQLEISQGLRRKMFRGLNRQDRQSTTPVFKSFVEAIRSVLSRGDQGLNSG